MVMILYIKSKFIFIEIFIEHLVDYKQGNIKVYHSLLLLSSICAVYNHIFAMYEKDLMKVLQTSECSERRHDAAQVSDMM